MQPVTWDDDDIHLPWRIAETIKALPEEQFYMCPQAWLSVGGKLAGDPRLADGIYLGVGDVRDPRGELARDRQDRPVRASGEASAVRAATRSS